MVWGDGVEGSLQKKRNHRWRMAVLADIGFRYENGQGARYGWARKWFIVMPPHLMRNRGLVAGPYKTRHAAVERALEQIGV